MGDHAFVPDDNSPAADATQAMIVVVFFAAAVVVGLIVLGGVPLFGMGGGADHHAEAGAEAH
ncbi:MAG: hypothetical protein H6732_16505 [Alphaproteobacteria bacterium]|nr:hypothetical protein [Alphaproteobacteria bacterium]